jgi:hypothetical protein
LRAGLPFFLLVEVRLGVTLSIFASADNALGSIGSSFSSWTGLVFFGTDWIDLTTLIGLLRVGQLASRFSAGLGDDANV